MVFLNELCLFMTSQKYCLFRTPCRLNHAYLLIREQSEQDRLTACNGTVPLIWGWVQFPFGAKAAQTDRQIDSHRGLANPLEHQYLIKFGINYKSAEII